MREGGNILTFSFKKDVQYITYLSFIPKYIWDHPATFLRRHKSCLGFLIFVFLKFRETRNNTKNLPVSQKFRLFHE